MTDDLGFDTEEDKKAAEERDIENKDFLEFVKSSIGDGVSRVKLSNKLADMPCALTTEGGITLEMEKYFRRGPSEEMRKVRANRVLELNAEHKAVKALKAAFDANDTERAGHLAKVLETLAEMMAGCEVEDPAGFVTLVSDLF